MNVIFFCNLGVSQLESYEREGDISVHKLMSLFILLKISLYCVWGDTRNVHGNLPQAGSTWIFQVKQGHPLHTPPPGLGENVGLS